MEVGSMDVYLAEESVNQDRLSELPDSLIHLIFSFLSMREVVSTTLLSKRWNNLWSTLPYLSFHEDVTDGAIERIRNFVNRALLLWNGNKILKFRISFDNLFDSSLAGDMDLWVRFAMQNEVEELGIDLSYSPNDELVENTYWVLQCLNSCSSLRKLFLVGCKLLIDGPPSWNQLKSLRIGSYHLSEILINWILLGSPRLQVFELSLMGSRDNLSIMSTSLKELVIYRYGYFDLEKSTLDTVFRICCPNLEIFDFYGAVYGKCLFTDISSLIDATLYFDVIYNVDGDRWLLDELFGEPLRKVFSTHVEKVELSNWCARWCVQVLGALSTKYWVSPSVKCLKLGGLHICEFGDMMDLLAMFPNLKSLVIEDLAITKPPNFNEVNLVEFESNLSNSFLLQLTTVEIISHLRNLSDFGFIGFLFKHAIKLEKLVLRANGIISYSETMFQVSKKLRSMPKSSPTATVIIKND